MTEVWIDVLPGRLDGAMDRALAGVVLSLGLLVSPLILGGCKAQQADAEAEAPPAAHVTPDFDVSSFTVDHPEHFPLATAIEHDAPSTLVTTGVVAPDVARTVPVISLASGRVVSINARIGDTVKKGQVLLRVRSDDISGAFASYQMAVADESLSKAQLDRAQELYQHGAVALNDLQIAQDAEAKAKVAVDTGAEHLRLLGSVVEHSSGIVDIVAPISGVITDQQATNAAGVQSLGTSPFTISDLTSVWIICDVYENDLASVRVGDTAEIRLNAYPDKLLKGRISNIAPILDPSIRTGKVRVEVMNPGLMSLGMFVAATFHGQKKEIHIAIPSSAILHLHDRDFVYVPSPDNKFRRVEVQSGDSLPDGLQEIKSGIQSGQKVVSNALVMQNTVEQ
jgi:membrane fusion protein, heavy metal efflux system